MSNPSYNERIRTLLPGQGVIGQEVGQVIVQSTSDAITAFAGGGQANATPLTSTVNRITVVATAGDSVKLPPALAGMRVTVINSDAADSANVFPSTGDSINAIAANGAFALASTKTADFVCPVNGKWFTVPLAP